jgi:D-alanyl-D-alanine endopeptidase (penicillin-binding protein 7)
VLSVRRGVFAKFAVALAATIYSLAAAAAAAPAHAPSGPQLKSTAALIMDSGTGEVIYEQKPGLVTPIASITKLMTALVVLDAEQPIDEVVQITGEDKWSGKGAFSRLPVGQKMTRADLLRLALMASENRASHTLARNYPGGTAAFVRTMNQKAKSLGMTQTKFEDPSGLSNNNVSNARDLAKLVAAASKQPLIREYSTLHSYDVKLGRNRFTYRNTNLLVGRPDWEINVQKTGFTNDAGECLVMQATIEDRPVTMVFLDSFGKLTRTAEARRMRKWMAATQPEKMAAGGAELAKK